MILDIGPVRRISQSQARIIETGNIMQKRAWARYKQTLDQTHADRAEYWRELTEKAVEVNRD